MLNDVESLKGRKVTLHDMCLRDGMHAKREQISVEQMVKVATALDDAGVPYLQVTHGAGMGGNSLQHGFAPHSNEEYISAVAAKMKQAKVSVLLIPGLGTMKELKSAYDCGARSVHVATHATEADTSPQHIAFARKLGMDTTGFLMMAHLNSPDGLAQQGKLMESYGAQTIYITENGYLPASVKVQPNSVVEFVNVDVSEHASKGSNWDSGLLAPGQSYKVKLTTLGTYQYSDSAATPAEAQIIVGEAVAGGNSIYLPLVSR